MKQVYASRQLQQTLKKRFHLQKLLSFLVTRTEKVWLLLKLGLNTTDTMWVALYEKFVVFKETRNCKLWNCYFLQSFTAMWTTWKADTSPLRLTTNISFPYTPFLSSYDYWNGKQLWKFEGVPSCQNMSPGDIPWDRKTVLK